MWRVSAVFLLAVACIGSPSTGDVGPRLGLWQREDWFCSRGGAVTCSPPAYFSPLPDEVEIRSGGVLIWMGGVGHTGAVETACIRVPAASEGGVPRTETTFCNLIEDGVVNETRAFVIIGWSPGTADECTCSAHFDYIE